MNHKHIEIDDAFRSTVRALRVDQNMTKTDLAEKAGLSIRTIQDIEAGRNIRIQEKTLLLLASALSTDVSGLLDSGQGDQSSLGLPAAGEYGRTIKKHINESYRIRSFVLAVIVLLLAVLAFSVRQWGRTHATWSIENRQITVREAILGTKMWQSSTPPNVISAIDSPWSEHHLIIGLDSSTLVGGQLLCLDKATADTIWATKPDVEAIARAFGSEIVMKANFGFNYLTVGDLDGDGECEVIARATHGLYYPCAICVVDRNGTLTSQYANRGHILDILVTDIDSDGKDEILATGTNNDAAYNGATVILLDDVHRNGASIDVMSLSLSTEPDSALVRVVFPQFPQPFMNAMKQTRLTATVPKVYLGADGNAMISVFVGDPGQCTLPINLDSDLRPIGCTVSDSFKEVIRSEWPDSLRAAPGPLDPTWRAEWLATYKRYAAGH